MAQTVLGFAWFADGYDDHELSAVAILATIAFHQPDQARRLLSFPWLADDLTSFEVHALNMLHVFFWLSSSLLELTLGLPWIGDDITEHESQAGDYFADVARYDLSLAERLMGLPWIADGVTENEPQAIRHVGGLMEEHPLLAERLMGLTWIADGVTESEVEILSFVGDVIKIAPEVVGLVETLPSEAGELTKEAVNSLRSILWSGPDRLKLLLSQPRFQDGLTNEEAALIVVLRSTIHQQDVFRGLIEGAKVVSDTFSLPLTGEVHAYVVSRFPLQGDVLQHIRIGMGTIEDFMGSPWKPYMIGLEEPEWDHPQGIVAGGAWAGTHFVLRRARRYSVYHEMAHYYFGNMTQWLDEGGADFLKSYVLYTSDKDAHFSPESLQRGLRSGAIATCANAGASNIQEWIDAPKEKKSRLKSGAGPLAYCHYALGQSFLLGMYNSLGHETVMASMRQLYESKRERSVTEDDIYETFLSNTPPAKQDEFRDLYSCLHGRPIPGYTPTARVTPTHVRDALVALYNSTNGPDWKNNRNWLGEAPVGQWHGVVTNCDGDVVALQLGANNLAGPIPEELGRLSDLKYLHLSRNQLAGPIPPELANASKLNLLLLDGNQLTGHIPRELGRLSDLEYLHLSRNQLAGPIPPELANASKLNLLFLDGNQLTGHIPRELGRLSDLEYLHLSRNQLAGPIPPELGSLSNLTELLAAANQLSGPIPAELGNLANLTQLNLALSKLSGQIPPELGSLPNLEILVLARNELTGAIPPNLGKLSKLEWLLLSDNQLTGPIPPELGSLSNLKILNLGDDQLIGTIPPELGSLSSLTHLRLDGNQLTGPVPPELANLSELERLLLAGNQLTGCIPKELQSVENNDFMDTNLPFC